MGDIYADGGSSGYPVSLDTATTQEDTTAPLAFGPKVARASKINNLATAIIALETELGTTPSDAADDTVTPADAASTVKVKLNMILTVLKAIIGGAGWKTTVPGSLTSIKTTADAAFVAPSSPAVGDMIRRNTGNSQWERFPKGTTGTVLTMGAAVPDWALLLLHGKCQLVLDGSNLRLNPKDGNTLVINSVIQTIPDAGVALAVSGAAASTFYYIYAYMSGATMTLEFSATGYSTQAGTGIAIKTADATRTLVGMARTTAGTAWANSVTQRLVRSYFNRIPEVGFNGFTASRATTSTSYVELNSEIRIEFVVWGDEAVEYFGGGYGANNTGGNWIATNVGFDGTTPEDFMTLNQDSGANYAGPVSFSAAKTGLVEGYHYVTLLGKVNSGTGSWVGAAAGAGSARCTLRILLGK